MAPNPRVLKAFSAMNDLGIPAGTVKPVLKNLLKLYDKNWELIEEDNYRTLADAIFECADDKRREDKEKDAMEYDGSKRPLRKLHLEQQEDQVSSTLDYANTIWGLEEGEVPQTSIVPELVESTQSCLRDRKTESSSHSLPPAFIDKGKDPISSELALKVTKPSPKRASSALYSSQERDGPDLDNMLPEKRHKDCCDEGFVVPTVKPSVSGVPHLAIPISIVPSALPGKLEGSSNGNISIQCRRSSPGDCLPHIMGPNREAPNISISGRDLIIKEVNCSPSYNPCKRSSQRISDITKGTENVRISLLNETGTEQLPNFVYIPQNIIYQNAYIQFSLARIADDDCCSSCLGDCLSLSVPCECARDTAGEFAYNPQGLLKEEFLRACISMNKEPQNHFHFYCEDCPLERAKNGNKPEPCKGHLVRKFIKECWRKCGCDMQCGNRVVQRGITCKLQVFLTNEGKGWGVRTLQDLPKGAFICEYIGEILTNMELYDRNKQSSGNERHTYPVLLDADWSSEGVLKDEDALCLDATFYGNVARFINHRCFDANLLEIPVEVETPDHHYYHLAFFTTRKVDALEELTWDYGIDFDDHNHPIRAFQCYCGSAFCRDMRGKRTKSGAFRRPTT